MPQELAERHLVVYIDPMNGLPWVALTEFEPPFTLPNLPKEITDLWLLGHGEKVSEFVVWYASIKRYWSSLRMRRMEPEISQKPCSFCFSKT